MAPPLVRYVRRRRSAVGLRQRMNARKSASSAQRRGLLTPQPCEVCGSLDVEKHHEDYDKPLQVRWLCRADHAAITRGAQTMAPTDLPDPELDRSTWFTKQEVAARLEVTTKTVERLAQEGALQQGRWRRPGGGPALVVYHPLDVARLIQKRQPGGLPAFLVPGSEMPPANGNGQRSTALATVPEPSNDLLPAGNNLLRALVAGAVKVMSETSQTSERIGGERLYLTLPEAAAWTGLTEAYLRRKCRDGSLPAVKDQAWKIKRTDLETL